MSSASTTSTEPLPIGAAAAAIGCSGRVITAMNLLPYELYTDLPAQDAADVFVETAIEVSKELERERRNSLEQGDGDGDEATVVVETGEKESRSSSSRTGSSAVHSGGDMPLYVRGRRGNSALYSGQAFLESGTEWETVLVAWTGEIANFDKRVAHNVAVAAASAGKHHVPQSDDFRLTPGERATAEELLISEAEKNGSKIAPVFLHDGGDQSKWRAYAEQVLWQLLHYILGEPSDGLEEKKWWLDYVKFNEAFADKICEIYKPGDIIWIHDYHLLLLPQILRQRLPKVYIGTFLHAPFPSSEYFRYLTKRRELLEGMLGSNMIGFQSSSYARHFISSCTRVLGFESTDTTVDAFGARVVVSTLPIGIDADRVQRDMDTASVRENMRAIKELYQGKKIIVGRDRLDSVRGVIQKLRAFEMFCQMYPEMVENVVLIQVTSPAYAHAANFEKKVAELVAHINGTYGMLHFTPVQHYPQQIARDEYFALLRVADLALITSVRDGMNTTSLEYVVCQRDDHGVVILSEFTGTVGNLSDAIMVNPWDSVGVAKTIYESLTMGAEDKAKLEAKLFKNVTTNTIQAWVTQYLAGLVSSLAAYAQSHMTPVLDKPLVYEKYEQAGKSLRRRLFLFDYDGTLTPIVREPSAAIPTAKVLRTLKLLAEDRLNQVWIISGRDQQFLEQHLGHIKQLGLSAEHGCFIRQIGSDNWINLTESFDMSWQKDVIEIFQYYTERTQGSFIERKRAAVTWHYRRADPEYGAFQARECLNHLENTVTLKYDVEVMSGKANLEVRPRFVNKGEIVRKLAQADDKQAVPGFVLCLGDDATDEDMFRALRKLHEESNDDGAAAAAAAEKAAEPLDAASVFTVTVGPSSKMTTAAWHLLDPHEVVDTLAELVGEADVHAEAGSTLKEVQ
ncbi:glycosyltransferase family 20-domain-containing protein [Lipomyces japonicus]|uniref:glycosyltransferase family 20-domain-containing protein n=1 Tax=Lipomyces japonicus TaxID=56871 RepID=UPI0034CEAF3B